MGEFSSNGGTPVQAGDELRQLLTAATLASDATIEPNTHNDPGGNWDIKGDPTEGALVVAAAKAGLEKDLTGSSSRVNRRSPSPPKRNA
jgi:P-type Ca2+ transporter type 2C